jgi:hypothetical protein
MVFLINRVKNTPVTNRILDHAWQVGVQWIMTKVCYIGREPFGFIQQTLGHGLFGGTEVVEHGWEVADTIPGHCELPAEAEFFGDLISGYAF